MQDNNDLRLAATALRETTAFFKRLDGAAEASGRGLHSSTFQLNLRRFGHLLLSPCLIDWGKSMHQTYPTKCAYVDPKSERV